MMKKRLISLLMALVMLLACVPAMAANNDPNGSGLDVVILIDRSGTMRNTDPSGIALAATKMFADRCNSRDNSVAVVTYGYEILTETDFYDLSSNGKVDQLRDEVDTCTIQDSNEDTNTGMALQHVYNKIAARRTQFPNHKFAILVISDGKIDIGDSKAFKADARYPDKGQATQDMLIQESTAIGAATAATCAGENIPVYCLGIYSQKSNILGDDMSNWSATTGGMYRDTDDVNEVYNIIREMYLDMTGNPNSIPVTDGTFQIPDNALEANVEIVPSIQVGKMAMIRPNGSNVDLSGNDMSVKIREDAQYTMVKLIKPEAGEWKMTFADGMSHDLTVYVTCNLDLNMLLYVKETEYNCTPVTVELEATKQKAPYYDPSHMPTMTVTQNGATVQQGAMSWNPATSRYEFTFVPSVMGEYRFRAELETANMVNVATRNAEGAEAVLNVIPRIVSKAQDLGDYAFTGRLMHGYTPVDYVTDLSSYFHDYDNRGIVGYEVELSEQNFITAAVDASGRLTYTALKPTVSPIIVTVHAIDGMGEKSEALTGSVTVEDAQLPVMVVPGSAPTEEIKIRAMLPEKQGHAVMSGLSGCFAEPNAIDGESIISIEAHAQTGTGSVEVSVVNDELILRGLAAGKVDVYVTATSSDGSQDGFTVNVKIENLLTTILLIVGGILLLLIIIALVIWAVVQANKPPFAATSSLTITLIGDDEYEGTDMLRKYNKRKVKLSEICAKAGMFTSGFGDHLDKITVRPRKGGVVVQCSIKNVSQKEFNLRPYDSRTIDVDPVNGYSVKLEYFAD